MIFYDKTKAAFFVFRFSVIFHVHCRIILRFFKSPKYKIPILFFKKINKDIIFTSISKNIVQCGYADLIVWDS